MPVKLAGNTLPTDSSVELLELVPSFFFFFSFLFFSLFVSFLDSVPPTRADYAPLGVELGIGDFKGLKFLKVNIFFFFGVCSPSKPTCVDALCNGALNGANPFLSFRSPRADPGSYLVPLSLRFLSTLPNDGNLFICFKQFLIYMEFLI